MLVEFGVRAGNAPVLIGSLGYLGLGVRAPIPEWGLMISENRTAIASCPSAVLAPGMALAGLVIGLNLFAEGLARSLGSAGRSRVRCFIAPAATRHGRSNATVGGKPRP